MRCLQCNLFPESRGAWARLVPRGDLIVFGGRGSGAGGMPDVPTRFTFGVADSDVFLVDSRGSALRRILNGAGGEDLPPFSEDGERIIFLRLGQIEIGAGNDELAGLVLGPPDGRYERRLSVGLAPLPDYSADGGFIACDRRPRDRFEREPHAATAADDAAPAPGSHLVQAARPTPPARKRP